ncbi:hypothetical protein ILUMI_16946 [Ignelater luminosus]|uniref:Uncharacterized protein n=1 Tax=Ignelater luminosus TaxID=2038154 RepID=A0A8K0G5H3_IGNLU|nr:hypothetical protein ILUMI_16946 [Ignelater luminosus]
MLAEAGTWWISEAFWIFRFTKGEKECIEQLGADEDKIKNLYLRYSAPEDDTQFNNFMECVWKKLEFLTENGDINYEKLKNSTYVLGKIGEDNPEVFSKFGKFAFDAASKCESNHALLKADTAGETAVKVQNCIVGNVINARASLS